MDFSTAQFEAERLRLKAIAYRMLGSLADAEDAVQETWLRLARTDRSEIDNFGGWLTTVVSRICLDMLRARSRRAEVSLEARMPDPLISIEGVADPEQEAILADAVGLALQVVLDELTPAERLAFVLHDVFGLPFEQIAPIVDRTPVTAKKLASRARQRVHDATPAPDPDLAGQRRVVDAFQAAARDGDLEALLAVLDPDVVLRVDGGTATGGMQTVRGATAVAARATAFRAAGGARDTRPVLVNGVAGFVNVIDGRPASVMGFTIVAGKIVGIDLLVDPERMSAVTFAG